VEKLLPQNIEAECGVLGSIIIDPEAIVQVSDFLHADDFYRDAHHTIFEVILQLYEEHEPADFLRGPVRRQVVVRSRRRAVFGTRHSKAERDHQERGHERERDEQLEEREPARVAPHGRAPGSGGFSAEARSVASSTWRVPSQSTLTVIR